MWLSTSPPAKPEPISRHQVGGSFKGFASLAFSPDGKTLVSCFANFTHLARDGKLVGRCGCSHSAATRGEAHSEARHRRELQPGRQAVPRRRGGKAEVYDAATGKELFKVEARSGAVQRRRQGAVRSRRKVLECDADDGQGTEVHAPARRRNGRGTTSRFPPTASGSPPNSGRTSACTTSRPARGEPTDRAPQRIAIRRVRGQRLAVFSPDGKHLAARA